MDKINFTGYNNIARRYIPIKNSETCANLHKMIIPLTDPHLNKFQRLLGKNGLINADTLQIDILELKDYDSLSRTPYIPFLNGKLLSFEIKNIPILKELANILEDISKSKNLRITEDFMKNEQALNSLNIENCPDIPIPKEDLADLADSFNPDFVHEQAKDLHDIFEHRANKIIVMSN